MTSRNPDRAASRLRRVADRAGSRGASLVTRLQLIPVAVAEGARWPVLAVAGLVGLFAFTLRALVLSRGIEIQVDEPIYLRISQNLANHLSLTYGLGEESWPFFLHPPLFFVIEALFLKVVGQSGGAIGQIVSARYLAAGFGASSAILLFLLCRRVAGFGAGLMAAFLFSIEPFVILMDTRNLLEPEATFWMLLGLYLTAPLAGVRGASDDGALGRCPDPGASKEISWRPVVAGLAFGGALLTNEPAAFMTLLPVALASFLRVIPRRDGAVIIATALGIYSVYPIWVILSGNWSQFEYQKFQGLGRFIGTMKSTGFSAPGGPSFVASVIDKVSAFGTTYAVLALGVPATILIVMRSSRLRLIACWSGDRPFLRGYNVVRSTEAVLAFGVPATIALALRGGPRLRLVACWSLSAYVFEGYNIVLGTNEEQYFYYVVVLAILTITVATSLGTPLELSLTPAGRLISAATLLVVVLFVTWCGSFEINRYVTPDDAERQLLAYAGTHMPRDSKIATTNPTDAILLEESGYRVTNMTQVTAEPSTKIRGPSTLMAGHPDYVIIETELVATGYGIGTPQLLEWLYDHATLIYTIHSPTDGTVLIYRLPPGRVS